MHPSEAKSTVGTAWILRRSISNMKWIRTKGTDLDDDPGFLEILHAQETVPLLLFPGPRAFNLNHASAEAWKNLIPGARRPIFFVIDGTWSQANVILKHSRLLRSLPRVSFETSSASEYGFKAQPHPACLSSVEGVHRVIEVLASRGWCPRPEQGEHDRMIDIFRRMVAFQLGQERNPRVDARLLRRAAAEAGGPQ